jgi:hypothetical protein
VEDVKQRSRHERLAGAHFADKGETAAVLEGAGEAGDAVGLSRKRAAQQLGDARVRTLGPRVVERGVLARHALGQRPSEGAEVVRDGLDFFEGHRTS